ncbi:MAG TPA: redoxin family protein [Phenylobacterium sp.]|nr:redoxin family protein [Phenylobacterium sp.]
MSGRLKVGERLPDVELAYLEAGELHTVRPDAVFAGRRAILIGLPGAFTPVCHGRHLPSLVAAWPDLKAAGFDFMAWLSPNDPWTQDAWAAQLDPHNRLRRFSDGNLAFARAAGLTCWASDVFMGERCERFLMILRNAVVEHVTIEPHHMTFSCTSSSAVWEVA